ncbi:hypothetical protein [Streptosporangium saharense]|uniref:hypothetical protein n=1 Tax=Streptosporangium saharense TaxID=1706840 RepID=UPI00341549C4
MTDKRDHTFSICFRIPRSMWDAYGSLTARLGTDRSARLLDHIRADIRQHGGHEELADLEAAEQELAERRARRGGRPRRASEDE